MRKRCRKIIEVMLNKGGTATAKELALELGVTDRSIKNYVTEINYEHPGLIEASRKGYQLHPVKGRQIFQNVSNQLPESSEERVNYIIKSLLNCDAKKQEFVDLFELENEIFVSIETLKKDLVKVRKLVSEYNLYANVSKTMVWLEGKEVDKRRLLSSLLYDEFNKNVLSLELIQKAFPTYNVNLLQKIIQNQCSKHHYFINDFSMVNLLLDVVITIDRIQNKHTFYTHMVEITELSAWEQKVTDRIMDEIETEFRIVLDEQERHELAALLLSHMTKLDMSVLNRENIHSYVDEKCSEVVAATLECLNENYYLDNDNEDFFVKFTIHVNSLLHRLEVGHDMKNPLTEHIKTSCPMIFECAVAAANCISRQTGYRISEDEIAYIALHIGGNLANYELLKNKIECFLLFPQYYDMADIVIKRISEEFADSILISQVVSRESELTQAKEDSLIISTVGIMDSKWKNAVFIQPFLSDRDIHRIQKKIMEIKDSERLKKLRTNLEKVTSPELFLKNSSLQTQEQALSYMVDRLVSLGYVEDSFYGEVIEREQQSSTAFGRLAVPHSLHMTSKKTGIFIFLSDKPVQWGSGAVNVILLFAINREDRKLFHDIFDSLVVMLLENEKLEQVLQSKDYHQFLECLLLEFK